MIRINKNFSAFSKTVCSLKSGYTYTQSFHLKWTQISNFRMHSSSVSGQNNAILHNLDPQKNRPNVQQKYYLSDFVDIQRKSFFTLLEKGLIEEFSKRNPITNSNKTMELYFYPEYYQLTAPEHTPSQAIVKSKSYTSRLYIPVQLTDKTSNCIKLKWVYIGNIPLMTKRGHFILNGCARVIVNQMIRSPGIYFQKKINENYADKWSEKPDNIFERYYADLICNRGTWLRLEIDKYNQIWAQMKRVPKIPIMWLLIAMGLPEKIILKRISDSNMLLYNFASSPGIESQSYLSNKSGETPMFKGKAPISKKTAGSLHGLEAPLQSKTKALYSKVDGKKASSRVSTTSMSKGNKSSAVKSQVKTKTEAPKKETRQTNSKQLPYVKTPPAAWAAIYNLVSPKKSKKGKSSSNSRRQNNMASGKKLDLSRKQMGRKWIFNKFMNPRTYDLGKVGRLNFNSKLNLSISLNQTTLTPQDLLLATDYLILVSKGLRQVDDIDHLKNRRVRTSGELIQLQIGIGLVRLEKNIREKMNKIHAQMSVTRNLTPFTTRDFSSIITSKKSLNKKVRRQASLNISNFKWSKRPYLPLALEGNKTAYLATGGGNTGRFNKQKTSSSFFGAFSWRRNAAQSEEKLTISNILNTKPFNGALKEFFGSSPLSQFLDQINPLAELTHKRRLSSMGPGGVTRDSATLEIRGIHPSHYGRICPVETPEGKNTGLVNSLTAYARVNSDGYIETPFYKVYKGQVQSKTGLFFFSAKQEEKLKLGAPDLYTTDIGFLPLASIPARIAEDFTKISRNTMEYVGVAPIQMISIATSLIPFFEHDDGNRALMGSNMQRQAVPILKPQRPIVGTGLEARAVSDSGHVIQTKQSGVVTYVSSNIIVLLT